MVVYQFNQKKRELQVFIAWKRMVSNEIMMAIRPATKKNTGLY